MTASADCGMPEFKVFEPDKEKELNETVHRALKQIETFHYEANLEAKGISSKHIRKYGFAFEGKKVLIGKYGLCYTQV